MNVQTKPNLGAAKRRLPFKWQRWPFRPSGRGAADTGIFICLALPWANSSYYC
jgi:hypothetical protein